ncbi:MAG: phytoene/squalene synthase family protein [Corynebacterium humireducens]|jgi:phytoene/squalene synthetase|uniref:Phytoene/squalene synthase family protein n=1 Tax=Corynebacterium humireducens TaxID=1223514 RepID=A0A7X6PNH8_9CORY|nr:phytoene/squalene synthase family protein [Corynebacterium humireducens]
MSEMVDPLRRFDRMAHRAAREVIGSYSTSFSLAAKLLAPGIRRDVQNIYAMVRVADEIVDGPAAEAGASPSALLDAYEQAVLASLTGRFSVDPVVHAFGLTARRCGIPAEHVTAFFRSMRADLTETSHTPESLEAYIYGSAEVVGLMCLAAFLVDHPVTPEERARLEHGARALGSAFQKINFLRDLAEDSRDLGRSYLGDLSDDTKPAFIAGIREELAAARDVLPLLPGQARVGVLAATDLFSELTDLLDAAPVAELRARRLSVPMRRKVALAARAMVKAGR